MLPDLLGRKPPQADTLTTPGHGEFEGVAGHYDHLMRGVPYRDWVDYVELILARRMSKPRQVLDLCCGTGKVGSEMLRRGYDVIGVDLSEPMVRGCARQAPPLPALVQDATRLGLRACCMDLVVSLYDSLNYILAPDRLRSCFTDVYGCLRPGGLFVFDMNTPRALSADLFSQDNLGSADPLQYTWKAHWDARTRLCRVEMWFRWRDGREGEEFTETHWQYAYRPREVVAMLREAGFTGVAAHEAYSFRPVTRWSDRAYFVARKE